MLLYRRVCRLGCSTAWVESLQSRASEASTEIGSEFHRPRLLVRLREHVRRRCSKNYNRFWCVLHVLLTVMILVSCGLHLRPHSQTLSFYFVPSIVLFVTGIPLRFFHILYVQHSVDARFSGNILTVWIPPRLWIAGGSLYAKLRGEDVCVAWVDEYKTKEAQLVKDDGSSFWTDKGNQVRVVRPKAGLEAIEERRKDSDRRIKVVLILPTILRSALDAERCWDIVQTSTLVVARGLIHNTRVFEILLHCLIRVPHDGC